MELVRSGASARFAILLLSVFCSLGAEAVGRRGGETADSVTFTCRELLGRPTDRSIALNLCTGIDAEVFVEYGLAPSSYGARTTTQPVQAGVPATIPIAPLLPDSRYFYRVCYRSLGGAAFSARDEHTFHTARPRGRPFVFAIEADPHLDSSTHPGLYGRTLANILGSGADFLIDLGDTFMSDKLPVKTPGEVLARHLLLRSSYDTLAHSVPLLLVLGNHEGEAGWLLNGTPDNLPAWAATTRMLYYPNPVPDGFYSCDTVEEGFVGLRQNYYAWEWGDAQFVVLDPYWYTTRKPGSSKNNWDWTLGRTQYDWLRRTLEQSNAPFKFVCAHQLVGGIDAEGRGGIEAVPFYEMGGWNADSTPGFAVNRPGWAKPIHDLMAENHVTAFFHGHDHVFAKQDLGGIVYQEVPQPGYYNFNNPEKSYANTGLAAQYGYTHGVIVSSSGYLRVTVTDTVATVDYVRSYLPEAENGQRHNGDVAYSYQLRPSAGATGLAETGHLPSTASLSQNYPNPFNPETTIRFQLPSESLVDLRVYDILGRELALLAHGTMPAGVHEVRWDASAISGGVYLYRLRTGDDRFTKMMSLVK
jgi:hypothetical protein